MFQLSSLSKDMQSDIWTDGAIDKTADEIQLSRSLMSAKADNLQEIVN